MARVAYFVLYLIPCSDHASRDVATDPLHQLLYDAHNFTCTLTKTRIENAKQR